MNDHKKTKRQLIDELKTLRQQIIELETEYKQEKTEYHQLLAVEREQRALAEALYQSATTLTSTLKGDEALDRILEQISRVLSYDAACVMLIRGEVARFYRWRGYAQYGNEDLIRTNNLFNLNSNPILQTIYQTSQPVAVSTVSEYDEWTQIFRKTWVKSYVCAPIISRGKVVGLLNVDSNTPNFFEQTDAEYLQAFADQAAIVLDNIWLHDQARHGRATEVLNSQNQLQGQAG